MNVRQVTFMIILCLNMSHVSWNARLQEATLLTSLISNDCANKTMETFSEKRSLPLLIGVIAGIALTGVAIVATLGPSFEVDEMKLAQDIGIAAFITVAALLTVRLTINLFRKRKSERYQ